MFLGVSSGVFVGEGFGVILYKPAEINIVFFLQLGRLSGSEPGAVTLAAEKPNLRGMRCIFPFS